MSEQNPVYAVAQLKVLDADALFTEYARPLQPINAKYGVEVLAASKDTQVVEGEYECNFTVILKFPSVEVQAEWYADPGYQPLITRRRELTDVNSSRLILVPSFAGKMS